MFIQEQSTKENTLLRSPKKKIKDISKSPGREVMVDIMYINDLTTERRDITNEISVKSPVIAKAKVNYHQELDLLSSHKKDEGST